MKRNLIKKALVLATVCAGLFSCATKGQNPNNAGTEQNSGNESSNESTSEKPKEEHPLKITDATYQKMMEKSVVDAGNGWRMKKVVDKIKNGDDIYVACIGGSVTEGECGQGVDFHNGYAYQFAKKLQSKYNPGSSNIHFYGAGLSGTPSLLGIVRYKKDVVEKLGHAPDLLVVEFAVNDDGAPEYTSAFEQLVRFGLEGNPECAVIGLYAAATYTNSQGSKIPVGKHYAIQQVSIPNALAARNNEFTITTNSDFFADYVHPTPAGHSIMCDALLNVIDVAYNKGDENPAEIPAEYFANPKFNGFTQIVPGTDDSNVSIQAGSFSGTDKNTQGLKIGGNSFPKNWYHTSGEEGLKMTLTCKNLVLVYKHGASWDKSVTFGTAEVYVDGKLAKTCEGAKDGGWNDCVPFLLINESEAKSHTVEVKMKSGDEEKAFTIVGMGYSK